MASNPSSFAFFTFSELESTKTTCRLLLSKYWAIILDSLLAPIIRIPSDFDKNTPNILAINLAVVALSKTVPSTIINTKGVINSAPGSPFLTNFNPNSEAIPAATIPLGPTQLINNFSLVFSFELAVLKNTPNGLTTKTTEANNKAVFQL